jgi:N-terminal domain of galactosyltransferase
MAPNGGERPLPAGGLLASRQGVPSLASAVADALVVAADRGAKDANPYYWQRAQEWLDGVVGPITACELSEVRHAALGLIELPASPACYRRLRERLVAWWNQRPEIVGPILERGWQARTRTRIGYHLGAEVGRDDGPLIGEPGSLQHAERPDGPAATLVIIPFRDRSPGGERVRNLIASLRSLCDQSAPPGEVHVVVVEADGCPRWRDRLEPGADQYVFAPAEGPFNKSWAVNVGVEVARMPADLVCVLDADILVDRHFVRRNVERFDHPAAGAHLPFRDVLYLDERSTRLAIDRRCRDGLPAVPLESVRGFLVRRAPGGCVWLRRDVFETVNGFDERFEGWGGEDIDFVLRLQLAAAVHFYDDALLHLWHPSTAPHTDAETEEREIPSVTAIRHIPVMSWPADAPRGRMPG